MKTKLFAVTPRGFTRVELVVVISVVVLLAAVLLPALTNAKAKADRIQCTNNLKQMGLSFRIFATDDADSFPMQPMTNRSGAPAYLSSGDAYRYFLSMSNELGNPLILRCPADRTRTSATNWATFKNENLSYFVSLDAKETEPQMMLNGDSNLTTNDVPVKPGLLVLTPKMNVGWTAERHLSTGNVVLGDGSVLQSSSIRLLEQNRNSAVTNRLLIP
jgi:type II secretory pathway pseudopilin PulG